MSMNTREFKPTAQFIESITDYFINTVSQVNLRLISRLEERWPNDIVKQASITIKVWALSIDPLNNNSHIKKEKKMLQNAYDKKITNFMSM